MALEKIELLVFVPGVPLNDVPNGVCTYASNLLDLFSGNGGVDIKLISKSAVPLGLAADTAYPYYLRNRSLPQRLLARLWGPGGYETIMAKRFGRFIGKNVGGASCVVEMEEAFGQSILVKKYTNAPVIVRLHGPWFLVGTNQGMAHDEVFADRVEKEGRAIFGADAVSAPSAFVLDAVERFYEKNIKKKIVLPNPFPVYTEAEQWKFDVQNKTIVFVGRFDKVKGADVFIEAMFKLASRRPAVRAVFIGPDNGRIEGERGALQGRAAFVSWCERKYGVASPIKFLGKKSRSEVARLRREGAVCVVASRTEMFPYAVAEAFAQGVPTVASRVGGIPEIIEEGRTGLMFEREDADGLCACVESVLDDAGLAVRLSENAKAVAREKFSGQALATAYLAFYRDVVNGHAQGA